VSQIRVFIATSLDGFIAGPNDELDWLPGHGEGMEDTFTPFMAEIGAMLMGRRTFDVVLGFNDWFYGDTPVLVATNRPLDPPNPAVRAVQGDIADLVAQAKAAAGEKDVYIDGGALIRSAMDAGLVDELTISLVPKILGAGIPLFAGSSRRHRLELLDSRPIGSGLVQLRYRRLAD
jgi:dihydrofolate reductase